MLASTERSDQQSVLCDVHAIQYADTSYTPIGSRCQSSKRPMANPEQLVQCATKAVQLSPRLVVECQDPCYRDMTSKRSFGLLRAVHLKPGNLLVVCPVVDVSSVGVKRSIATARADLGSRSDGRRRVSKPAPNLSQRCLYMVGGTNTGHQPAVARSGLGKTEPLRSP